MTQFFLAGDVGGTKTRLAVFSKKSDGSFERNETKQYKSADYPDLQTIINLFLADLKDIKPKRGSIGVPGPVANGEVKITNLPWELSEREIEAATSLDRMVLVNDLFATTAAVPYLNSSQLGTVIDAGFAPPYGVAAVIAPGTGTGMGFLVRSAKGDIVLASEGGHARFAPSNQLEIELMQFLMKRDPYVSVEHLLCGPGIRNIYEFLAAKSPDMVSDALRKEIAAAADVAAVVSQKALSDSDAICVEALNVFLGILGSHCGNTAVTNLATAGIYLGGGIPPRIAAKLNSPIFKKRFLDRGKMSHLVEKISVHLIKDDYAALTGAASVASTV